MNEEVNPYGFNSFAEVVTAIGKLSQLETAISTAIEKSQVPPLETRKLLKTNTVEQARNVALVQFMKNIFKDIGLGNFELVDVGNFRFVFEVTDSPVCELYPQEKNRRTCFITSDALTRFFTDDLSLPAEVKETKCCNAGDEKCVFEVSMQPLAVYQMVLDATDRQLVAKCVEGKKPVEAGHELDLPQDELDYRISNLKKYHVIEDDEVTEIGRTYHNYGRNLFSEDEEDFPPPWVAYSRITREISASSSFAEAVSETTEEDTEEIEDREVKNMAEEAQKSKSFAELISKKVKEGDD